MIRFLFRLVAVLSLAIAVIFAVLDAARSVGASTLVMTPLLKVWASNSPETLGDAEALSAHYINGHAWELVFAHVLQQPAWLFFALLAFVLYAIGHRRERALGRFAAR